MTPIFDSHLDLAWIATAFNRDLALPVDEIRQRESHMTDHRSRGRNVLSFPELRRSAVGICVATLLARGGPAQTPQPQYLRHDLDFANPSLAHANAHGQLAWYRLMESQGRIRILRTRRDVEVHWKTWNNAPATSPLGIILSMEGTDPITHPDEARDWFNAGLRAAGLAHYGVGQHAHGTGVCGPLSATGIELLRVMDDLGMILDVTHLCDLSMAQALDYFEGPILASHHNCRALVAGDRQLSDQQIKRLIERKAIIGAALDAWMLYPDWIRGKTPPEVVSLEDYANHIDHICQIAGNTNHAAVGTDLDGGFGNEQTPHDLRVYSDLQKLASILQRRGYSDSAIAAVFYSNWLTFFSSKLPD